MFNSITGIINKKGSDHLFLQTQDLEWEIFTTAQTLAGMPNPGERTKIYTFLYHKDDQMKLFGFSSTAERDVFLDLIKVDGVGPKLSVKILSGIKTDDFIKSVENEDLLTLTSVPGLGKKTAQKIILSLKGRLSFNGETEGLFADVITALTGMGFDRKESAGAYKKACEILKLRTNTDDRENHLKEILRETLRILSSGK